MELKTLRRIMLEFSAAADLSTALGLVVERVRETLQADAASIFLNDDEHGEYVLMAADGMAVERPDKIRLKYGQGLVGMVGEREEPINIDKAQEHPQYVYYPGVEESAYHA